MIFMKCNYYIIEITTHEALNQVFFTFSGKGKFVYRGHANCTWRLQPTLEKKLELLKDIDIR